ncbi:MAG: HEPN domain-containing protein [Methanosarcinaceae archaeon]|nr:HEPN domain-containing protein [Methanosarcinaceae archaeon]
MDNVNLQPIAFHERMLEMAINDLGASMKLYKLGYYPQAIFLFQQAVEKSTKSFGIWMKGITPEQAKSSKHIGHASVRVFEKSVRTFGDYIDQFRSVAENEPAMQKIIGVTDFDTGPLKSQIEETADFFGNCASKMKKKNDLSEEGLSKILDYYYKMENKLDEAFSSFEETDFKRDEIDGLNQEALKMMVPILEEMPEHADEIVKGINNLYDSFADKEVVKSLLETVFCMISVLTGLFCLSIITQPHAVISRYPEDDFDPLEYYTKKRPIVHALSSMYLIAKKSVGQIEFLYDMIDYEVNENE